MTFSEKFTSRLKDSRKERKYTQSGIINALSDRYPDKIDDKEFPNTDKAWGNYENGKREPSLEIVSIICKQLGISSDYLLGLSDEKKPQAKKFSEATGLSESSISVLVSMREDKATAGLDIINQLFETGAFLKALSHINIAKHINDNLCNELSDKVKPYAEAIRIENNLSHNLADMIISGEIVRDYHITKATEELMNVITTIVKGETDNGKR